jgi:hypothetical protein
MRKKIETKYIVAILGLLGVLFLGVSYYIQSQQSEYISMMKVLIAQQETTLTSIAEVTDRNGADAVVTAIIRDCQLEDRQRFDELLSSLQALNNKELSEVDNLFNACGDFYAQRKALMVARLSREFEVYEDYVVLLQVVDSREKTIEYPVEKWSQLVSFEKERSELSSELVSIQKDIIDALINGVSADAVSMKEKVAQAQEVKDNLSLLGVKIDALRDDVIDL